MTSGEIVEALEALEGLLEWAEQADGQIHGEFGVGPYEAADEIVRAREAVVPWQRFCRG